MMTALKTSHLVPKLRFPEFRATPGWQLEEVGPFLQECSDRVSASTHLPVFTSSRLGLQPQEEYYGGNRVRNAGEYGVVPPGCIVYRHMSDDGVFAFNINTTGNPIAVSKEYPVFRCVGIDTRFLHAMLNHSPAFLAFAIRQKAGGTRTRLYLSRLRTWITHLPSRSEQQKIADCLGSLDDLIAAEDRKLEALRQHKQGLMQQLFPQPGETVPRLRFSEFENAGDWGELKLIDVADKSKKWSFIGGPFGSNLKSSDYVPKGIRVIQLQNIGDAEFLDDYKIFTSIEKADELLSNNIYSGEIILSKMGDPVGRACFIPDSDHRYVMCSDGIRLVVDEKQYCKHFVCSLINSRHFRELVESAATGSTRKRIGLDHLKQLPMLIPLLPEQLKIADCLGSLDNLIAAEGRKLKALRQHKRGLMQQLFPQLDGR